MRIIFRVSFHFSDRAASDIGVVSGFHMVQQDEEHEGGGGVGGSRMRRRHSWTVGAKGRLCQPPCAVS